MTNVVAVSNGSNSVVYGPQALLTIHTTGSKLTVGAGGTLSTNTYKWYNASGLVYTKKGDSTYTPTIGGNYYAVITSTTATGLTLRTDTIAAGSLPIRFENISAKLSNGKTVIAWQTTSELNTSHFIIQRSNNGTSYTNLGSVNAMGSGANSYSFTDISPISGTNFYRLSSVDNNGAVTYSKVVSVSFASSELGIKIYPNPAKSSITILGDHIASVQIVDNMGKLLSSLSYKDASAPSLSVDGLPAGIYRLHILTTDSKMRSVCFVKE